MIACRNRSAGGFGIGYEVIMDSIRVVGYFKGEVVKFGVKGARLSFLIYYNCDSFRLLGNYLVGNKIEGMLFGYFLDKEHYQK